MAIILVVSCSRGAHHWNIFFVIFLEVFSHCDNFFLDTYYHHHLYHSRHHGHHFCLCYAVNNYFFPSTVFIIIFIIITRRGHCVCFSICEQLFLDVHLRFDWTFSASLLRFRLRNGTLPSSYHSSYHLILLIAFHRKSRQWNTWNQWRKLFELFLTCPEPETLGDPRDA